MKTIFALAGAAALLFEALGAAKAVEPRKNERYCIEMAEEESVSGLQCNFETLEQCRASKTTPGDQCSLNPILAFREREKSSTNWRTRP
jgi:Protein of unknown function (DUF3551)